PADPSVKHRCITMDRRWITDPLREPPMVCQLRNREVGTNTRQRKGKAAERRCVLTNCRYSINRDRFRRFASRVQRITDGTPVHFLKWLQSTEWTPHYISGSRIKTEDSPLNRQYTLKLPSFLSHISEKAVVRGLLLRLAGASLMMVVLYM
ncbi:hypothetical protein HAX54_052090, partial [Datura stramonium]|nr:hypothetical protein [Datura stramonium]